MTIVKDAFSKKWTLFIGFVISIAMMSAGCYWVSKHSDTSIWDLTVVVELKFGAIPLIVLSVFSIPISGLALSFNRPEDDYDGEFAKTILKYNRVVWAILFVSLIIFFASASSDYEIKIYDDYGRGVSGFLHTHMTVPEIEAHITRPGLHDPSTPEALLDQIVSLGFGYRA